MEKAKLPNRAECLRLLGLTDERGCKNSLEGEPYLIFFLNHAASTMESFMLVTFFRVSVDMAVRKGLITPERGTLVEVFMAPIIFRQLFKDRPVFVEEAIAEYRALWQELPSIQELRAVHFWGV